MNYSAIESALSDVTQRVVQAQKQVDQARVNLQAAKQSLTSIEAAYAAVWQAIEDNLATAPDHAFESVQKARKDALQAEIAAAITDIDAKIAALT